MFLKILDYVLRNFQNSGLCSQNFVFMIFLKRVLNFLKILYYVYDSSKRVLNFLDYVSENSVICAWYTCRFHVVTIKTTILFFTFCGSTNKVEMQYRHIIINVPDSQCILLSPKIDEIQTMNSMVGPTTSGVGSSALHVLYSFIQNDMKKIIGTLQLLITVHLLVLIALSSL